MTPWRAASSAVSDRLWARTRMPQGRARRATPFPIMPKPIRPSVRPSSPGFRSGSRSVQRPVRTARSHLISLRTTANINPSAIVAVASCTTGALVTATPRRVASATSMPL